MHDRKTVRYNKTGFGRPLIASLLLTVSLVAAVGLPTAISVAQRQETRYFVVKIWADTTQKPPIAQLFFDIGSGFRQEDSASKSFPADGKYHQLVFRIPNQPLQALRFDPLNGEGIFRMRNPSMVNRNWEVRVSFEPEDIGSLFHIKDRTVSQTDIVYRTVPGANDPQLLLPIADSFHRHWKKKIVARVFRTVVGQLLLLFPPLFIAAYLCGAERYLPGTRIEKTVLYGEGSSRRWVSTCRIYAPAILLYGSFLLLRSWENLLNPGLYVEDSRHYFNFYYSGARPLSSVLQKPHGYYNLLNNIVAWTAAKADIRLQPLIYQTVSVLLATGAAVCLMFSNLFHNRWILLVVPTVLGLSGMNHVFYYTTLTFQMYVVVVWLLCLLFLPAPKTTGGAIALALVSALLIWSGPYSVVAVPAAFLFLLFFRDRGKNRLMLWVIICALGYSLTAQGLAQFGNILQPGIAMAMAYTLLEKVLLMDLLGESSWWKGVVLFLLIGGAVHRLRREPNYIRISTILFSIIFLALAPFFLSVKFFRYEVYSCHLFLSQFFWLTWLLYTADRLLLNAGGKKLLSAAVAAAFLTLVFIDNRQNPHKGATAVMTEMNRFLNTVHAAEQLRYEEKERYVVLSYENGTFDPTVRVGSRERGAKRVGRDAFPVDQGKDFVVE